MSINVIDVKTSIKDVMVATNYFKASLVLRCFGRGLNYYSYPNKSFCLANV